MSLDSNEILNNQISLSVHDDIGMTVKIKPTSIWLRIFLLLLCSLTFMGVSRILIDFIFGDLRMKLLTLLGMGLLALATIYLMRLILWNTYGKEVIKINEDEINYFADYKWFKDNKRSFTRSETMWEMIQAHDDSELVYLQLSQDEEILQIAISVSKEEMQAVFRELIALKVFSSQT